MDWTQNSRKASGDWIRDNLIWLAWAVSFAVSFPTYNLSFTIWFAFVPVLVFAYIRPVHLTVRYAFFYSMLFVMLAFFWIYGFWWGGLFMIMPIYGTFIAFIFLMIAFTSRRLKSLRFILAPFLWIAGELVRSIGYHGFQWNLAGHSQWNNPVFIQSADIFGVWGVSLLILLVNSVQAEVIERAITKGSLSKSIRKNQWKLAFVLFLFSANIVYGIIQYRHYSRISVESPKEKVALIQPNIGTWEKWWERRWEWYGIIWKLNAEAALHKPDMIIWSETMIRHLAWETVKDSSPQSEAYRYTIRYFMLPSELNTPIFFTAPTTDGKHYYNSGDYLDPLTNTSQRNSKVHLVPFGEWMPLYDRLPGFADVMRHYGAGSYWPSTNLDVIQARKSRFRLLVCYEDAFDIMARVFIKKRVNYFVNSTNDGWAYVLGFTHPHWQHLACSVLTAVSVRRPIARASNTGYTGIVDVTGRHSKDAGDYKRDILVGDVPVIPDTIETFYVNAGFVFPYLVSLAAVILVIFAAFFAREKTDKTED